MEARATVPSECLDFTPPTVTSDRDGSWALTTNNVSAADRGVYNIYRSRDPIPDSERNGTWYIMVDHKGNNYGDIWTPTFITYTA